MADVDTNLVVKVLTPIWNTKTEKAILGACPDDEKNWPHDDPYAGAWAMKQRIGKTCIRHSAHDFSKLPAIGTHAAIRYDANQATASQEGLNRGRGVKR